jgi:penicillin amidase
MRRLYGILLLLLSCGIIYCLDRPWGSVPALGRILDPVNGVLANAEARDLGYDRSNTLSGVQKQVEILMERRMVPHLNAQNDHDLYFIQGYLHAFHRLWQMDMQTRAAGGRVSELIGSKALNFDRTQRRKGMVYAAERSLQAMEAEPRTKAMLDAYSSGVNAYIASLNYRTYPLEYKLMGFSPERWTNLKCALLLKYMADDLTGKTDDFELSQLRTALGQQTFDMLFPERSPDPATVIPAGTAFAAGSLPVPIKPAAFDELFPSIGSRQEGASTASLRSREEQEGIGSNNWVVGGKRTKSGAPILCNDPHLGLNLPSLWYEMQLQAPGINVYGVSLPGAPGIVIGFNDSLSWGFTNNYRDVKDFYRISSIDKDHYSFDGRAESFEKRVEVIRVKDSVTYNDTVLYTVHGPVMFDASYRSPAQDSSQYALTWMAHRGTNELLSLYLLNRATNYTGFTEAIQHFECPAQNFVYADRHNNIALWGQGRFINKWKDQGRFVMEGENSKTLWGADIPMNENPHVLNPPQNYVASANQTVTDTTYPYWYNGNFTEFRGWRINQMLTKIWTHDLSIDDMMLMQVDDYSILAEKIKTQLCKSVDTQTLNQQRRYMLAGLGNWNKRLTADSREATLFQLWWFYLYHELWSDPMDHIAGNFYPSPEWTAKWLRDSLIQSPNGLSSLRTKPQTIIQESFRKACDSLDRLRARDHWKPVFTMWYMAKNTSVTHLAKIPAFSYNYLHTGGWGNAVNAMKQNHGPSWRMIVEMGKDNIRAFGVYPGGQSGNPGSPYYASFLDTWAKGEYFPLVFLDRAHKHLPEAIRYKWVIKKA